MQSTDNSTQSNKNQTTTKKKKDIYLNPVNEIQKQNPSLEFDLNRAET
jgi:hypothetical protein